jgi:hypothetical protein
MNHKRAIDGKNKNTKKPRAPNIATTSDVTYMNVIGIQTEGFVSTRVYVCVGVGG